MSLVHGNLLKFYKDLKFLVLIHCLTASFIVAIFFLLSFKNSFWKDSKYKYIIYLKTFYNLYKNDRH